MPSKRAARVYQGTPRNLTLLAHRLRAGDLVAVPTALQAAGIEYESAEASFLPSVTVELDEESKAKSVLRVIDALEEHDEVQNVYANFDIPDDVLQSVYA